MMATDHDGDSALVEAFLAGDREAFAYLILRYRGRVVSLAAAVLGDVAGGEDVAQEASYQAYFEIDRLREPTRFGSWLCGIAINLAKMSLRRERSLLSLDALTGGRYDPLESAYLAPTMEQVLEVRELQGKVQTALRLLSPDMRAAVWLHYVEGMSYLEIGAVTGIPPSRLRVLSHRARGRLQRELTDEWKQRTPSKPVRRRAMEVSVDSVWIRMRKDGQFDAVRRFPRWVLILKAKEADQAMSIFVGPNEANATTMQLAGLLPPRPQTYAFIERPLSGVNAKVERVTVEDLVEDTFLATVTLRTGRRSIDVDARPSDALNLALASSAPVFIADHLMERIGFPHSELAARLNASVSDQDNEGLAWRSGTEWVRELQGQEQKLMREERASVQMTVRRMNQDLQPEVP